MGFSTSGSLLIVFAGLFLALGSFYTVTANTAERMAGATDEQRERFDDVQRSQVNATAAVWNESGDGNLTIRIDNTGETTLSVDAVDVVVDGEYAGLGGFDRIEVEGVETDVWRPGEQLELEADEGFPSAPERVKVVTGPGVADTVPVEVSG